MGHPAGLRAGTRVRSIYQYFIEGCGIRLERELTRQTVCLLEGFQEEGYDQAVNIPETIQVWIAVLGHEMIRELIAILELAIS
jgi:hypothetical protein